MRSAHIVTAWIGDTKKAMTQQGYDTAINTQTDPPGGSTVSGRSLISMLTIWSDVQIVCIYGPADAAASPNPIISCLI